MHHLFYSLKNSGDDQAVLGIVNDGTSYGAYINQGTTGTGVGLNVYSNVNATATGSLVSCRVIVTGKRDIVTGKHLETS